MKEYPPRPKKEKILPPISICECNHTWDNHVDSGEMLLSLPPQIVKSHCELCMCPKYKWDHDEKMVKLS